MKYLFLILLALLAFQATYSQEVEMEDALGEEDLETEAAGTINVSALQPDVSGNTNIPVNEFMSSEFHKHIVDFVALWQSHSLKGYQYVQASKTYLLEKVNYIQYTPAENAWKIDVRLSDPENINPSDFVTGHSVVQFSQTPNTTIKILRSKYGIGTDQAGPITDPDLIDELYNGWSDMTPEAAQQDSAVKALLDWAVDFAIQAAVPRNLPNGNWSFNSLTAVYIQEKSDGGKVYHFNVLLSGPYTYTARCDIAVRKNTDGSKSFLDVGIDYLFPANSEI